MPDPIVLPSSRFLRRPRRPAFALWVGYKGRCEMDDASHGCVALELRAEYMWRGYVHASMGRGRRRVHDPPETAGRYARSHTHAGGRLPRRTRVSKLLRCVDTGLEAQFKRHAWDGCGGGATTGWRCPHAPPQDLQTGGARCPAHTYQESRRARDACEKGLRPLAGVSRSAPPPHRGLPQRKNPLRENKPIRTTEKSKNRRQLKIC